MQKIKNKEEMRLGRLIKKLNMYMCVAKIIATR